MNLGELLDALQRMMREGYPLETTLTIVMDNGDTYGIHGIEKCLDEGHEDELLITVDEP